MLLTVETKSNQEKRVRYYCRTRDAKGVEACLGRTTTEEQLFQALEVRCGTLPASTNEPSTSAMPSIRVSINVRPLM